ncbi:Serine phosphatase RsbU, regulator of sigma subunit [Pedococcus cremeus]|uniref:Serine phosphatase RsbU, regulator of sigma subunit n=1 Tax=Pedococcus cremeus TaxID=587636 RepID=A0A1H9TN02_9MICO|nr:Serine phosphatase RsbU, regulator of sigma subunit [Pedococcus cremeus]
MAVSGDRPDPRPGQPRLLDAFDDAAPGTSSTLARLARVTSELATADSVEAVKQIIVTHAADAVGAPIATLSLRDDEDTLRIIGLRGLEEHQADRWRRYPVGTATPSSRAVVTGKTVTAVGRTEMLEHFPELRTTLEGDQSVVGLPLRSADHTMGAIGLSFPGDRRLTSAELEFLEIVADTCAQALERINALEEAANQTAKLAFLADAAGELASSLDYETTLARVARLAVPRFADWCAIDLVNGTRLHRVAVAHVDPAKVELARTLQDAYPPDPDSPVGPWEVVRSGNPLLIAEITPEMLEAVATDEEQVRIARELQLCSALTVPLAARGKVFGVITWVYAESGRHFGSDDVAFAEDLARRAAVAIDNAELHSQTLAAAVELQRAVLPEALPALPGWELASHYSPSGRTEVGGDFYDAIPLGGGRIAVFVGDVMGRGVHAAAAMAQMRAAVRAYAAVDPSPEAVLRSLDIMLARYPSEQLVTLLYLVLNPRHDELMVANAGHPPAVLLRSDLSTEQLPWADGAPLGVGRRRRGLSRMSFRTGDTLVAFTDGLIERRDEDIEQGMKRVHEAMPAMAGSSLDTALDHLVTQLRLELHDDDVAAVAVRRTG